ncbi:ATP-binding cassette domain-containing protein [Dubosiella newyorkensis]|uniref:ATP-binding cassette domain-containing protein n=1 Tax=Dubosiella newyorkensis TaxID=1862672 RepID=UPI0023F16F12|nr:ABC transporter ATP-binding protein [Dubosiella newyorkensis]
MIDIKNVSKSFGTKKAVDDIRFQVPSGSITGFIGPNGAGKTTTIHMMTGALGIDQGEILLNGIDIAKNPIQAKREFGLVPDSPDLFLRLSAREYINFMADIYQIDQSLRNQRIGQLAKDFQIESDLDQPLSSFSHGMRQKAIIIGL